METTTGHHGSHEDDVLFYERKRLGLYFSALAVTFGGLAVYALVDGLRAGLPTARVVGPALFAASLAVFVLFMAFGPLGPELKHTRVDRHGVWVRGRLLPADQIGRVSVLGHSQAMRVAFSSRWERMWLLRGVCTYNYFSNTGHAVAVEQHRPDGTRRPWILGTHHPRQLSEAVRAVREAALPAHDRCRHVEHS